MPSHTRIARDYNRTLSPPVRLLHTISAALRDLFSPLTDLAAAPPRRLWLPPLLWAAIFAAILIPIDGPISAWCVSHQPRGDLRRELEILQQYGDFITTTIAVLIILLLDPARRAQLLNLLAALAFTALVIGAMKIGIGRPRPEFDDPLYFMGPLASYPIDPEVGVRHAWEIGSGISSKLWSMPSSHTAYAVVLSVFLTRLYPRLKPLTIALPILVGLCRVLFRAHYPSDAAVGALVAFATARPAIHNAWGERLVARLTRST